MFVSKSFGNLQATLIKRFFCFCDCTLAIYHDLSCRTLTPVIAKMLHVFNIALHLSTQLHSDQMSFTQKMF